MSHPQDELAVLVAALERDVPRRSKWPGGWPREIDAALIDAVLSIRSRYGGQRTGVRGAVRRWQDWRRELGGADDLEVLAGAPSGGLTRVLNRQTTGGQLKYTAIQQAAANLLEVHVRHASDVNLDDSGQRHAYTSVRGLGPITWTYFGMLLGKPGVKADRWIVRYVERAIDPSGVRGITSKDANHWLTDAALRLERDPTELDHAVWLFARRHRSSS